MRIFLSTVWLCGLCCFFMTQAISDMCCFFMCLYRFYRLHRQPVLEYKLSVLKPRSKVTFEGKTSILSVQAIHNLKIMS